MPRLPVDHVSYDRRVPSLSLGRMAVRPAGLLPGTTKPYAGSAGFRELVGRVDDPERSLVLDAQRLPVHPIGEDDREVFEIRHRDIDLVVVERDDGAAVALGGHLSVSPAEPRLDTLFAGRRRSPRVRLFFDYGRTLLSSQRRGIAISNMHP